MRRASTRSAKTRLGERQRTAPDGFLLPATIRPRTRVQAGSR